MQQQPLTCGSAVPVQVEAALAGLPGDCIVAAAFLSYAGPFPSELRDQLVQRSWLQQVRQGAPGCLTHGMP